MCSPLGHSLAAAALGRKRLQRAGFRTWIFVAALSVLPDVDFLFGVFAGAPNRYYHQWTHSIVFAALSAFLVFAGFRIVEKRWNLAWGGLAFVLVFSHIVLDFFAKDARPAYGMPIFWPFSDRFFLSPVALFSDIVKESANRSFFPSLFCRHNAVTALREALLVGPFALWAWRDRLRRGGHELQSHRHFRRHSDLQRTGERAAAVPGAEDGA